MQNFKENITIHMKKILVILGPTATGKTDLAIKVAKQIDGELVAADSRQVYRGLDVGAGKMPGKMQNENGKIKIEKQRGNWVIDGVKIWMYDVVDPMVRYDVSRFSKEAGGVLEDILERGKLPIIVGGTGLYIKALLYGFSNLTIPIEVNLRNELEKLGVRELQEKLLRLSPTLFSGLNNSEKNNPRRLIRQIEMLTLNLGKPEPQFTGHKIPVTNVLKIGLAAPRLILNERIDQRVLNRIGQGMISEAEELKKNGLTFKRMRELGLEYRYLADYIEGVIKTKDEFINILQNKIHQYAKRQITWFKKEQGVNWFDIQDENMAYKVENLVKEWYNG
jgi:tRNA dimethylallyltransferase